MTLHGHHWADPSGGLLSGTAHKETTTLTPLTQHQPENRKNLCSRNPLRHTPGLPCKQVAFSHFGAFLSSTEIHTQLMACPAWAQPRMEPLAEPRAILQSCNPAALSPNQIRAVTQRANLHPASCISTILSISWTIRLPEMS